MRPERIPLFPLNVVLLPGAELPLHIFEPRYREMVRRCLARKLEFGMLLSLPKGLARAPFRVLEFFTESSLLEGRVEYLQDREPPADLPTDRNLIELYETCYTLVFGDYPKNLDGPGAKFPSYIIAGTLPMDLPWKQQILELRSEMERQTRLVKYLRDWAPHLQNAATVRGHAEGNGHGLN
jgi:Lon protease-like protein